MKENNSLMEKRTRNERFNLAGFGIGWGMIFFGQILFLLRAISPDTMDSAGYLTENHFILTPIAFASLISGVLAILLIGIKNLFETLRSGDVPFRNKNIRISCFCAVIVFAFLLLFCFLIAANS